MSNIFSHINNHKEISNSKKVGCLYCCKIYDQEEIEILDDTFLSLDIKFCCPNCGVSNLLIGDYSGIELNESTIKCISYEVTNERRK